MTTKEALQALIDGKKIKPSSWGSENEFIHINDEGKFENSYGDERYIFDPAMTYELYQEPKKTKQVWQWRYTSDAIGREWHVSPMLMSESRAQNYFESQGVQYWLIHAGPFEVEE